MPRRFLIALCGVALLFSGVAQSAPAEAATRHSVSITTNYIGVTKSGVGRVYAWCNSNRTCKGSVSFDKGEVKTEFSLPAGARRFITIALKPRSGSDPYRYGTPVGMIKRKSSRLVVDETSPKRVTHDYGRKVDTHLDRNRQILKGTITGAAGSEEVTGVRVNLMELRRGGVEHRANSVPVTMEEQPDGTWKGTYRFGIRMGSNNRPLVSNYFLKIEGDSPQGHRSWWWRGYSDRYFGGARYSKEASNITATRYSEFVADFEYGFLKGKVLAPNNKAGVGISVAAPITRSYGSDVRGLQALDVERCANIYANTTTNATGNYRADFLPLGNSRYVRENRYMVRARSGANEVWIGANDASGSRRYGSCYDAVDYATFRSNPANLLKLNENTPNLDVNVPLDSPSQFVRVTLPKLFRGALPNDRWITVRERIPGMGILDSPVAAQGQAFRSNQRDFMLPQGQYWIETGRRTSCSDWYSSIYSSNNAYFSGADRGAERWKTVAGKNEEHAKSVAMGYVRKSPPSGRRGWMYRDYCKSLSAGTYDTVVVRSSNVYKTVKTAKKGAVAYGKVTRSGGRTNKELMVRLSKSDSTAVLRTDLTDSSGRFYVAGLMPGRYTISVNSDSWRGIGRSFTGKRTIYVSGSKYYNVGTLNFKG